MSPVSAADHAFWLKVMAEHGMFIFDHLSPREDRWAREAGQFTEAYGRLRQSLPPDGAAPSAAFAGEALALCRRFLAFKLALLRQRIDNAVVINLTPAFFNGIILEWTSTSAC